MHGNNSYFAIRLLQFFTNLLCICHPNWVLSLCRAIRDPLRLNVHAIAHNHWLISTPEFSDQVTADWFDAKYWRKQGAIIGESQGRNTTYFCRYQDPNNQKHEWVLRHYYRGGLFGKFVRDKYRFSSVKATRVFKEMQLLQAIQTHNLPGPKPIAGEVIKQGLCYRCNILIEKIPNAKDAFHLLCKSELNKEQWKSIGQCIKKFHNHNIYHSDLNIHNIMLDNHQQCYLIDFDKGEICPTIKGWKKSNLNRLLRSLKKEQDKNDTFYFSQSDWQLLIDAYNTFN